MLNMFLIGILCWISVTDIYTRRIPDSAIFAAIGFRFFSMLIQEGFFWERIVVLLFDGLLVVLPLLVVVFVTEKISRKYLFGGGDMKLLFVTGIYLGWEKNLWVMFIACLFGCVFGLAQIRKPKEETLYFPFGPFIAIAAVISMNVF